MGLNVDDAQFLIAAQAWGVRYDHVLTIGRQNFYVNALNLERLLATRRHSLPPQLAADALRDPFADTFLRVLGADRVDALDVSNYEGAAIIHDLNQPLPDDLKATYDAVIEVGTLEHIFDSRQALTNVMELVRADGHLLIVSPANNWFGHGFHQFGPEFYFRALCAENGYRVVRMIVREDFEGSPWHDVADPAEVGTRAQLLSPLPVSLMIVAQRVRVQPVLHAAPMQSDYPTIWRARQEPPARTSPSVANRVSDYARRMIWRYAPTLALARRRRRHIKRLYAMEANSTRDRRFYTPAPRE